MKDQKLYLTKQYYLQQPQKNNMIKFKSDEKMCNTCAFKNDNTSP